MPSLEAYFSLLKCEHWAWKDGEYLIEFLNQFSSLYFILDS
jgi:uncharacterized protein YukJ